MSDLIQIAWLIAETCYFYVGLSVPVFVLVFLVTLLMLVFRKITWLHFRQLAAGYSKCASVGAFVVLGAGFFELSTLRFVEAGPDTAMAAGIAMLLISIPLSTLSLGAALISLPRSPRRIWTALVALLASCFPILSDWLRFR